MPACREKASARPGSCQVLSTINENDRGRPRARIAATHRLHEPPCHISLSLFHRKMHWNVHTL
jgi:hypothetical protein